MKLIKYKHESFLGGAGADDANLVAFLIARKSDRLVVLLHRLFCSPSFLLPRDLPATGWFQFNLAPVLADEGCIAGRLLDVDGR